MDTAHWKRVNDLFNRAADLPSGERQAFLEQACGADTDVMADVLALLEADQESHVVLDGMAAEALDFPTDQVVVGELIGPYRVIKRLGSGGMGEVYLAERADGHFEQQVALKLIKRGMDTKEILARFASERQILAGLQHPHIGRLLDGGATKDGRPFYAMEYVDGETIVDYCDRERLSVEQRLSLFGNVCDAVRYAQEHLVVHRDLKPSNILVTRDGTVKLLDFGIAKVLEGGSGAAMRADATRAGQRVMTPAYASPEQIRGEEVTTATDVYTLGVILFELLTGRRPFRLEGLTPQQVEERIVSTEPPRPSKEVTAPGTGEPMEIGRNRSTVPDRLRRRLSGDLDNICLMALRKDPRRRYASAAELQEDLKRHTDGRTVRARPDSFAYRSQKFLSRHKLAVAAVSAVLLVAVSLVTFYTAQLADERDRARQEAIKAEQVSEFLAGLFELADPETTRGEEVTARDMLERGARSIRDELADQPGVQAQMLLVIGQVYRNLGLYSQAHQSILQSLNLRRELFGPESTEVAEAYSRLADILFYEGELDSAGAVAISALELWRNLDGPHDSAIAVDLMLLGWQQEEVGDYAAAESLFTQALATRRATYAGDHPLLAESIQGMSSLAYAQADFAKSERLLRDALAMNIRLHGEVHPDVYVIYNDLGLALEQLGRLEEAEAAYQRSLEISRQLYGEDHHSADAHAFLGRTHLGFQDSPRAEFHFREALRLRQIGLTTTHFLIGYDWKSLADVLRGQGKLALADSAYEQALTIYRANAPDADAYMASALLGKGRTLTKMDRAEEALPLMQEGLNIRESMLGPDHWVTASARGHVGGCLTRLGRYDEAQELLLNTHALFTEQFGPDDRRASFTAQRLAELYAAWDKPDLQARYAQPSQP